MSEADWDLVVRVHLRGTFSCTRAAMKVMTKNKKGRIVNTGSTTGLFGHFGTSGYASAKMGIHGLTMTTAYEGKKHNVYCNMILPVAYTRLSNSNPWTEDMIKHLDVKLVAPTVAYLSHPSCKVNGKVFFTGAGYTSQIRYERSHGVYLPTKEITPEGVATHWEKTSDYSNPVYPTSYNAVWLEVEKNIK